MDLCWVAIRIGEFVDALESQVMRFSKGEGVMFEIANAQVELKDLETRK